MTTQPTLLRRLKRPFSKVYYSIREQWPKWMTDCQRCASRLRALALRSQRLPEVRIRPELMERVARLEVIMDDICMPPFAPPKPIKFEHDDFHPLMALVQGIQPRLVLELGTAHGNTVANICRNSEQTRVVTINAPVEMQEGTITTFRLTPNEIGRVFRTHGFDDRVKQVFANTLHMNLDDHIQRGSVDFAVIDACHDTRFVINDFLKVLPFMSADGVIILHDTDQSMRLHTFGSYLACLKLRASGHDIRHIEGSWWGVWKRDWTSDKQGLFARAE